MPEAQVTDAVLLAAGKGERLWPLTATRPKPLVPIANEPLVSRLVRQLAAVGIRSVTVVVADAKDEVAAIATQAARRLGLRVELAVQREHMGTGHALQHVALPDARVLVGYADVFLPDDALAPFVGAAKHPRIGARRVPNPEDFGALDVRGKMLHRIAEKSAAPPSDLVNAGFYVLPTDFGEHLTGLKKSPRGEFELTDAVNAALRAGTAFEVFPFDTWLDVGYPWDVLTANEIALAKLQPGVAGTVEPGATLKGAVRVEEGAVVKSGAYIEGPVLIGPGATVGPNCYIRGSTTLGPGAKVGHACEVKNSVLFEHAKVPHLSYVGDSILGRDVNLGAGTVVANLRHDDRTIRVHTPRGLVDSRRRKLGVILGDGVKTGINATLNCGVMLGPGETVGPGEGVARSRV